MIPSGLLTQIGILIISVAIIFTYIKPAFGSISEKQDNIAAYKEEKKKVIAVNSRLAELVSQIESIDSESKYKIMTYLPDKFDEISVQRDIRFMLDKLGIVYKSLSLEDKRRQNGGTNSQQDDDVKPDIDRPQPHVISLEVSGDYEQLKELLALLESNAYPLELSSLKVSPSSSGVDLDITMDLIVYTYKDVSLSENESNQSDGTNSDGTN